MENEGELKTVSLDLKINEEGKFAALFAPFERWDKQNDWTERGAFGRQNVIISAYNHSSTAGDRLPVGKGVIYDGEDGGIVEGKFFLNTSAGRETYETVKGLGELQQWSYYLPKIESEQGERAGKRGRILKRIEVGEVCPVLRGVGNGTRTLAIKGEGMPFVEQYDAAICAIEEVCERLEGRADSRKSGRHSRPSASDLKRARSLDVRLGDIMRRLHALVKENDVIDEAWLTLQSFDMKGD